MRNRGSPAPTTSGVTGLVHLGPQCPVEREDEPCDDDPAANVTVTVSMQIPGDAYATGKLVASGTTGPQMAASESRSALVITS